MLPLAAERARHQKQSRPKHVTNLAVRVADHVRLRDELDAEQLCQRRRVDGIRLHFGVADRLEILRVAEPQVNALRYEQIPEPVPHAGALDDRLVWAREPGEVRGDDVALRRQVRFADQRAGRVQGVDRDRALVKVNAGIQHQGHSQTRGPRTCCR
jgi:hypothetical protein